MGDSSSEIVNKAAEHDYMSVIEQLVMASSTHSVFQADDAKDSAGSRRTPARRPTHPPGRAAAPQLLRSSTT
jgi:hypothetical protein